METKDLFWMSDGFVPKVWRLGLFAGAERLLVGVVDAMSSLDLSVVQQEIG